MTEHGAVILEFPDGGRREVDPVRLKAARLAAHLFGSRAGLASYLGVSRSQPGRWISGRERPSPEVARRLTDLEYVWDRATADLLPEAAKVWLRSPNAFLGATDPLTVLAVRGPAEVVAALDAEAAGSYT